ncbi:MAG: hypothetical protein CMC81_04545 [Flavobacteriaceae bacterium]|nr:hypothetical protein [Flavobacteriaceae bacterium]|tara:strand:- start:2195 stop:2539 length:345 start_codon:yes stop_codon:yes gene_type:complete
MEKIAIYCQIIIAVSVINVWVLRYDNIVKEFVQYGLSDLVRNVVGATKIALSTLLIVGIFYDKVVLISSLSMAFLMICAQLAHISVKNPLIKYIPSLTLLLLSLFVAGVNLGVL